MTRHNTAADKELPEDLPREVWAADRVWVRRGGHAPPLLTLYDGPYTVLQRSLRHFWLQLGNREDNVSTSRLKPCTGGAAVPTAAPPWRGRPCREPTARRPSVSASTSRPHHSHRKLTLEPFFLASLPGFLHAQGKHLQATTRNATGPPAWQWDYTFCAASRDQEAGRSSVAIPQKSWLRPSSQHETCA
jgi:hypothetical protein